MEFGNVLQKDGMEKRRNSDASKPVKIILCVVGIVALSVLLILIFAPSSMEYKQQHFYEYFDKLIDQDETALVENAFAQAEVAPEKDAREHLILLFSVLWLHQDMEDINITSAEIVEFSNSDVQGVGKFLDGYALRAVLDTGDSYTVFCGYHFERVLKNDSEEIWIAHTVDSIQP